VTAQQILYLVVNLQKINLSSRFLFLFNIKSSKLLIIFLATKSTIEQALILG